MDEFSYEVFRDHLLVKRIEFSLSLVLSVCDDNMWMTCSLSKLL